MQRAENYIEKSRVVEAAELGSAVDYVKGCLKAATQCESEARARGNTASGRLELETANSLTQKALGGIDVLGHLFEPPEGHANWYQAIVDEPTL